MESLYDAMDHVELPKMLQTRIFKYYDYIFVEHGTLDGNVQGFTPELGKNLQAEIFLWQVSERSELALRKTRIRATTKPTLISLNYIRFSHSLPPAHVFARRSGTT